MYFHYWLKKSRRVSNLFRYRGVCRISPRCDIGKGSVFEGSNYLGEGSIVSGVWGFGSYAGAQCELFGKIGRYTCIGDRVKVLVGMHPTREFVSIHPAFYSPKNNSISYVRTKKFDEYCYAQDDFDVVIGNDVWIGSDSIILSGVTIGDGAIIAAGSVVIEDVEPYSIVAGIPAMHKRKRFSDDDIEFLLGFKWWNKSQAWIKHHSDSFESIEVFKRVVIDDYKQ